MTGTVDAVVIGSGPNGLAAATVLGRAGWDVAVLERNAVAGGAVHSGELTVPGYVHDTYSAFYGLLHASPAFEELGLDRAVQWARAPSPVSAAVGPERAALCWPAPEDTAAGLEKLQAGDGKAWTELYRWWEEVGARFLRMSLHPVGALRPSLAFAWAALRHGPWEQARTMLSPVDAFATSRFAGDEARALVSAGASHFDVGVDQTGSTPATVILALAAQQVGFPVPVGGAGALARALVDVATAAGVTVHTGAEVCRVVVESSRAVGVETADGTAIRARRAVVADTTPTALFLSLLDAEADVPASYLEGIRRFRFGTGIFKVDLALDGPVPWIVPELGQSAVVHLTGSLRDMARAASEAGHGTVPARPMLVVGQQSVADASRAPRGGQTLWIETHVPGVPEGAGGWERRREPFLDVVLSLLEAHAPGLRGRIVGSAVRTPDDLARENPNLVGGDLGGGSAALDQQLVLRPVPGWFRYATPVRGLYLCSASTHPGGGVHGMAGRNAARRVLADRRRRRL